MPSDISRLMHKFIRKKYKMSLNNMKFKNKLVLLLLLAFGVFLMDYGGVFIHFQEKDFDTKFSYPYDGDVTEFVKQLRQGKVPSVAPINVYNYTFLSSATHKCDGEDIRLVLLVKSAAAHFERRQAIRNSWGFQGRFSDTEIRTVFFVGMVENVDVLMSVLRERDMYNDIVHINFVDAYFNNTIKTMSAMRWVVEYCSKSKFYLFSDDDMYISVKNVLRFLRNPVYYPKYLETAIPGQNVRNVFDIELPSDVVLYAGDVVLSTPLRHKSSKWYMSLEEYPYDRWPPYVTAGAFILSREALFRMYYTSMYTKHFRFDDIFLAFVALKAKVEPFHCNEFHFFHSAYFLSTYKYVIAAHGFDNPQSLLKVWNEQKANGFA